MTPSDAAGRPANRLAHETSPYLLQHALNPVDWYPWGEDAWRRARDEDRPVLLSIGYSACHWCHVMERESFEDEDIAALMNANFVCVKVDREERPDLDEVYMAATQALNGGQGGWPMTVFLTPSREPFFAGTYFPPVDAYGRPGFPTLLERIATFWREDRDALVAQAASLCAALRAHGAPAAPALVTTGEIEIAVAELARGFDPVHGGFGPAPKFPPAASLSVLLRHHQRTGDDQALVMVRTTLDGMAAGGIRDHIGGGFARYATDERWLVPHFEKMLYDNALLARIYLEASQASDDARYARVALEILDFVLAEMTGPEGAFYSALDADAEGEEGKFYVWTPAEVDAVVGADAGRCVAAYYDITDAGNWEGKSIPHTPASMESVATRFGMTAADLAVVLGAARPRLYAARRRRVAPATDDKVLVGWNGLMIGAMAEGARVLGDARFLAAGRAAADFLLTTLVRPEGGLYRTWRAGRAHAPAHLEDYAYFCDALIDLSEAGAAPRYLRAALRLAEEMIARFCAADDGAFYSTAHDHETLLFRHREGRDGATPSPNAVAARALVRLSYHFDRLDLRAAATAAIAAHGAEMARHPLLFATALGVVDFLSEAPVEIALVGAPDRAACAALAREVTRRYLPNRIVAHIDPSADTGDAPPLAAGKTLVGGAPALYLCRNFTCATPVTDPAAAAAALAAAAEPRAATAIRTLGEPLPGCATAAGTARYAARMRAALPPPLYATLARTGLSVSRFGFGAYRVSESESAHGEALAHALRRGINVVDTSTNYGDGGSERAIGRTLAVLCARGDVARDEIVVVSKIGYVQGRNLLLARRRAETGRPFPEMVQYAEDCWHCIHPEFLREQLDRSRARLGLATLDVCLLHNPEYFLIHAMQGAGVDLPAARDQFYARLARAFAFLEGEVGRGTIGCYGVSSNTVALAAHAPEATSLERMLDAARVAGGSTHRFRVLQLPLNLIESGAVLDAAGPPGDRTVLETAARLGVGVVINRPLNALGESGMLRLVDVVPTSDGPAPAPDAAAIDDAVREVAGCEDEYRRDIATVLRAAPGAAAPGDLFRWGERLAGAVAGLRGLEQWQHLEEEIVVPAVTRAVRALDGGLSGPLAERWGAWRAGYLPALERLLGLLRATAAARSRAGRGRLREAIDPHLPVVRRHEVLARKALWVLASTPGVDIVLSGMRRAAYVDDAVAVLGWAPLAEVAPIYRAVRETASRLTLFESSS